MTLRDDVHGLRLLGAYRRRHPWAAAFTYLCVVYGLLDIVFDVADKLYPRDRFEPRVVVPLVSSAFVLWVSVRLRQTGRAGRSRAETAVAAKYRSRRLLRAYSRRHPWVMPVVVFCTVYAVYDVTGDVFEWLWPPAFPGGLKYSMALTVSVLTFRIYRRPPQPQDAAGQSPEDRPGVASGRW